MDKNQTVSNEEKKIARLRFLKKALAVFAGLSILPGVTKASVKRDPQTKTQSSSGGKNVLSEYPFIGEIQMVAFDYAPQGWLFCNGQLLSISQYAPLFAVLGTTYGGNGTTNFALPDLRGRVPIHQGYSPGLSNYALGESGGSESVTLTVNQIPSHNHNIQVSSSVGTTDTPSSAYLAKNSEGVKQFAASADTTAQPTTSTGLTQAHSNVQPFCVINYIIATDGIFPARQ